MNKSLIIYGPHGTCSADDAEDLRAHFGLDRIISDWNRSDAIPPHGALIITHNPAPRIGSRSNAMHIGSAMCNMLGSHRR